MTYPRILFCILTLVIWFTSQDHYQHSRSILLRHIDSVKLIARGEIPSIFPGAYFIAAQVSTLFDLPAAHSLSYIASIHICFTFMAIFFVLYRLNNSPISTPMLMCMAVALMMCGAIVVPWLPDAIYNFTSSNRSSILWRNITHTTVQPYNILSFGFLCLYLRSEAQRDKRLYAMAAAGMLVCSTLFKPSFVITFIPAAALVFFHYMRRDPKALWKTACIFVPSAIVVAVQLYLLFFSDGLGAEIKKIHTSSTRGITFAPLAVWEENNVIPWLNFLLMSMFPLSVAAFRWRDFTLPTRLAWVNYLFATSLYALFSLSDDRNAEWGYWYGMQILFIASMLEWLRWRNADKTAAGESLLWRPINLCIMFFILHFASGFLRLVTLGTEKFY